MKLLFKRALEHVETPWKNGQGATRQFAIYPFESKFPDDPFVWRLSSAKISQSSPFSRFAGYERILTVIDGQGLEVGGKKMGLHEFIAFSGDLNFSAHLSSGPIEDFNIIYSPEFVKVHSKYLFLNAEDPDHFAKEMNSTFIFVFCIKGNVVVRVNREERVLGPGDTLLLDRSAKDSYVQVASPLWVEIVQQNPKSLSLFVQIDMITKSPL